MFLFWGDSLRVILHSDLNAFYASVECLHQLDIRHKPVAVCGHQELRHGIVLAKNQLAKQYGVKTGDAIWQNGKTADKEYLNALINYVKNRFTISTAILNTSYYDFAFHHEFIITDDNGNVITQPALPALPDGETVPPDEEGETETTGGAVPDGTEQAAPETTNAG